MSNNGRNGIHHSMRLVVIESPCAGDWERNQEYLRRCLRDSIERGEAPIASHGLFAFSGAFDDANLWERNKCMQAGWSWMDVADAVVVYEDYGISSGMQGGINAAAIYDCHVERRSIGPNPPPQQST